MAGELTGPLRTLFASGTAVGRTDGQLLERFHDRGDAGAEPAFAALVERHGPMVLRACRGVLHDDHAAMDAFQATFLVLARKAGSLRDGGSLAPWLHRVALRAAGRARRDASRRRAIELGASSAAGPRSGDGDRDSGDLLAAIHIEVDRLPDRYRSAVVLCVLEGLSCEQAAVRLGCPIGTVASRLARGRQRLRDALRRRGLAPSAVAFVRVLPDASISPTLVASTAAAAVRFVTIRAAGAAASLALEVLRSMTLIRIGQAATLLLALGASASGLATLADQDPEAADPPPVARPEPAPRRHRVERGKLDHHVSEGGSVEAVRVAVATNQAEVGTTIVRILPEGTRVKKGDLVCELDSSAIQDRILTSRIEQAKATTALEIARIAREVAELAARENEEGIYRKEFGATKAAIQRAQAAIDRAEARLKRTQSTRKGMDAMLAPHGGIPRTPADIAAELDIDDRLEAASRDVAVERAALEDAQNDQMILQQFTKEKMVRRHRLAVEEARSVESARQPALELERTRGEALARQLDRCKILAGGDGVVVYANDPNRVGGNNAPQIEEGAAVRERQLLFKVVDLDGPMRVAVKVPEAIVDRITPDLPVRISVDALPNAMLTGTVESVAPLPDPLTFANIGSKVYIARISIAEKQPDLRPSMTARVEILIASVEDTLAVPVKAVVVYDHKAHVAVEAPGRAVEWREVTLGLFTGEMIEVKQGLKPGEEVATDPVPLLSEEQRSKRARPTPPARGSRGTSPALRARLQTLTPRRSRSGRRRCPRATRRDPQGGRFHHRPDPGE